MIDEYSEVETTWPDEGSIADAIVELEAAGDVLSLQIAEWLKLLRSKVFDKISEVQKLSVTENDALIITVHDASYDEIEMIMQSGIDLMHDIYPEDAALPPIVLVTSDIASFTAIPRANVVDVLEANKQKYKQ